MMKANNKTVLFSVIFFGSIWGILEATLGYALHFLPVLISGSIMFPIAATIMVMTFHQTKSRSAMIYVALIAASLKSVNFFMPGLLPINTYNPMISIMLQSLVVYAVLPMVEKKSFAVQMLGLGIVSLSWRALFIMNIAINNALTGFMFNQLASSSTIISFIVISGLIEMAILIGLAAIQQLTKNKIQFSIKPHWALSLSMFIFAVVLTILL
ncbi:MAG TPA: hypothetical protein DEG42_06830 [Acholeplasmataceae bacterium]|nr:hypothetical protein [Acholeplasmataceae bacterium]